MSLKYLPTFLMLVIVDELCDAPGPQTQTPQSFIFKLSTRKTNTNKEHKMKESTIQRGDKKQTQTPKGTKVPTPDQQ